MMRRIVTTFVAVVVALGLTAAVKAQGKPSTLDTAKAKAWVGEWILTIEGRRGPQERPLTISDVGGKIAAELGGGRGGPTAITDISLNGSDLVLKWNQTTQQGEIPVVMTLTMKDGALTVKQDMANGQFSSTGTGKKKG
jgi:hypothetical protein